MRSTFLGFNAARSGLFAAQRALDITGHNISNVNTPGYTRQRLNQVQSDAMRLFGGQGTLGTGVDTVSITQFRNEFLDFKYRSEVNTEGYWEAKRDGLRFIEAIFNEPSDTGISTVIDELFESFQELSKNPENLTTRALVRQRGVAFANSANHMYSQLEKMAVDLNFDIKTTVDSINGYAEQIAKLNEQIFRYENDGSNANDLRDQRNLLLDELSKLVNVEVLEVHNHNDDVIKGQEGSKIGKKMVIQINGQPLVSHNRFTKLNADDEKASSFDSTLFMKEIKWEGGDKLDIRGLNGELKALLDLRDGNTGSSKGIPYYINELNRFVKTFADEINKIHTSAFGLNGSDGVAFFTAGGVDTPPLTPPLTDANLDPTDGSYIPELGGINAKNIKISLDIDNDLNTIAASNTVDLLPGDGSQALAINALRHKASMFQEGKPEDFIKSLISNLGVDTQEAIRMAANQTFLTEQINNQRQSISGVSIDEEMTHMVKFQHAYNASARMITTMDEMLDVIINRVGLVGR
ncbi:flagellar hook-associated protein FlgK [Alkaliphilus pronyensis]|uniref:Flagellar hook-associated protein 1 n=1 Tax=Alkaliphilus pronyensis TaxID=1482732 RepID=A0A6I0FK97_9FIRM|nr:flagellar hook-associated protein FlgK [Alkaliphilus pronyensis]KAB3539676.1 flagellar hook-associated protein FlgK [Alkaliphilus pronyensis]